MHKCIRKTEKKLNLEEGYFGVHGKYYFNLLAPELFFLILAHPVYKM
jgi:hypothetical protein